MTNRQSSPAAAVLAVVAGLTAIGVLVLAAVLIIGQIADSAADDSPAVAISSVPVPETTEVIPDTGSESNQIPTFDPGGTIEVVDDTGTVSITIPADWFDVSGTGWVIDGERVGPAITAAWNVEDWYSQWGIPGAFVGVSTTGFEPQSGDFSSVCSPGEGPTDMVGGAIAGTVTSWSDCGPEGSDFHVLVATPGDSSYSVLIQLVTIDGSGLETLQTLMNTFSYRP